MEPATEADAQEFGLHMRQGKWRLGLLVARNVENRGKGRPKSSIDDFGKISMQEYAEVAGVSPTTVSRYLKAWDEAAKKGLVPRSSDLTPGSEVPKLDDLTDEQWDKVYQAIVWQATHPRPTPVPVVPPSEGGPSRINWNLPSAVCGYETPQELIESIEVDISALLGPRYELNAADCERFENILLEALEGVRSYGNKEKQEVAGGVG